MIASETPAKVLVGVAGWSYADWTGLVYPRGSRIDRLRYLAEYFDVIEINTTFYAIPEPEVVRNWLRSVATRSDFQFTAKLHKQFTHGSQLREGQPEIQLEMANLFKDTIRPLWEARRLGALLVQFPYRFRNEPANREYLLRLLDTLQEYPLVVEVRHNSFNTAEFYQLLQERQVAFANIDQPALSDSLPATRVFTSVEIGYLRLHGRNAANWFAPKAGRDSRYHYFYSPEELETFTGMVQEFRHRRGTLYVIFNNHYRGGEVKNALEFLSQITGERVRVMPLLLKSHPELERIALPERPQVLPGENFRLFD